MRPHTASLLLLAAIAGGLGLLLWWRYAPRPRQWVTAFFGPLQRQVQTGPERPGAAAAPGRSRVQLLEEIERLERDRDGLQRELGQTAEVRRENAELRALLGLPARAGYRYVIGRTIGADPASGGRRRRLDRGRRHGVRLGQAVLAGDSLLGRVAEVADATCVVLTVSDPNCRVPAQIEGLPAQGILCGAGEERWVTQPFCLLKLLPRDLDYPVGARVVTSPFCETLPPALPIGELQPRRNGALVVTVDELYRNAWVKPFAFAAERRFLAVLVPE